MRAITCDVCNKTEPDPHLGNSSWMRVEHLPSKLEDEFAAYRAAMPKPVDLCSPRCLHAWIVRGSAGMCERSAGEPDRPDS